MRVAVRAKARQIQVRAESQTLQAAERKQRCAHSTHLRSWLVDIDVDGLQTHCVRAARRDAGMLVAVLREPRVVNDPVRAILRTHAGTCRYCPTAEPIALFGCIVAENPAVLYSAQQPFRRSVLHDDIAKERTVIVKSLLPIIPGGKHGPKTCKGEVILQHNDSILQNSCHWRATTRKTIATGYVDCCRWHAADATPLHSRVKEHTDPFWKKKNIQTATNGFLITCGRGKK